MDLVCGGGVRNDMLGRVGVGRVEKASLLGRERAVSLDKEKKTDNLEMRISKSCVCV